MNTATSDSKHPALSYKTLRHELYHEHPLNKGGAARLMIKFGWRKTVERAAKSRNKSTARAAAWALKLKPYEIEG